MEAEREAFGIDQREMMVLLLQDWGLPQLFIDAMYHQDDPQSSAFAENSRAMRLTYTLQLAALIAHACLHGQDDQALRDQLTACSAVLGFGPEQLELLHEQSLAYWRDWAGMLHITTRQYRPRPLDAAPIEAPTGTETMPEPAPRAETPLDILIACAEDDQRILLEKFLKASGHRVTSVDNGLAAFDAALQHMPQVLIADWLMPGADGLKLCADLRKTQAGRKMYFVLMTPFEDERRKMEAYQAGVDELLRTPVNTRLLAARLLAAQRTANHNNKTPP
jgi:PleD family two-component response regulator